MPLAASDLAQKFRMVPIQTSVTFTPKNPKGVAFTVAGARKRPVTDANEFESQGVTVTVGSIVWILPTVNLSGHDPVAGDMISDEDGDDWMIQTANWALAEAEWKCLCVKAR